MNINLGHCSARKSFGIGFGACVIVGMLCAAIFNNSFTTNPLAPALVYDPTNRVITIIVPAGSNAGGILLRSNAAIKVSISSASGDALFHNINASTTEVTEAKADRVQIGSVGASKLLRVDSDGYATPVTIGPGITFDGTTLSASTNGGAGVTYEYDFIISTNNFFISGKGNTLIMTNYVRFPYTRLTMSGTNVSQVNLDNGSAYWLTLTNTGHMVAPTGLPGTDLMQTIQITVQNAGGFALTWATNWFGSATNTPSITTNANAIEVFTFVTSPLSATELFGVNQRVR